MDSATALPFFQIERDLEGWESERRVILRNVTVRHFQTGPNGRAAPNTSRRQRGLFLQQDLTERNGSGEDKGTGQR
jgi:hypothetical protein